MEIYLIAKLKSFNDFMLCYKEGDEAKNYKGKNLLFYSLSNNDPESRYLISTFLLDKKIEVNCLNEDGENLLHILLSRVKHNLKQTEIICKRLIDSGININQIDNRGRVPLQYLINMKYSDEELENIYQLFFSQKNLLVNQKNAWGKTPLDIAEQIPYRKNFLKKLKEKNAGCGTGDCGTGDGSLSHGEN